MELKDSHHPVLIAEDDENEALLLKRALEKSGFKDPIYRTRDGRELLDYLQAIGPFDDRQKYPFPKTIYIDLKMPKVDGFEVLQWLKNHDECRVIPVIVLTNSRMDEDIKRAYQLGANCYLAKPPTFDELIALIGAVTRFWNMCETPTVPEPCIKVSIA